LAGFSKGQRPFEKDEEYFGVKKEEHHLLFANLAEVSNSRVVCKKSLSL
jgi:hypothetical protein